jgi:hypothetical protein
MQDTFPRQFLSIHIERSCFSIIKVKAFPLFAIILPYWIVGDNCLLISVIWVSVKRSKKEYIYYDLWVAVPVLAPVKKCLNVKNLKNTTDT